MYEIGQTSGVNPTTAKDGESTLTNLDDYVTKLAKGSSELPEKVLAPTKIIEVTDGCFSDAESHKTNADSTASTDGTSDAVESAADAAQADASASTQGSDELDPTKSQSILEQLSPFATYEDPVTGMKLVRLQQPSIISDVLNSEFISNSQKRQLSAEEFKRTYCDNSPYPECAACKNSKTIIDVNAYKLHSFLQSIADGIGALIRGNVDLATGIFNCPGQLAALCEDKLGPFGTIVGKSAAAAVIGLTALRGAAASFRNLANAYMYTDLRREVMTAAGRLLKNGLGIGGVGGAGSYVQQLSEIMTELGCTADSFTQLTTSGKSPWSSFADMSNFDFFSEAGISYTSYYPMTYLSAAKWCPTTTSVGKAATTLSTIKSSLTSADVIAANPQYADNNATTIPVNKRVDYVPNSDPIAKEGTNYYKKDPDTEEFVKIDVESGDDLETIRAQNGEIYEIEDNGLQDPPDDPVKTDDPVAVAGKEYYYLDENGEYKKIEIEPGQSLEDARAEHEDIYSKEVDTNPKSADPTLTEDEIAQPNTEYFKKDPDTGVFVKIDVAEGEELPEGDVYSKESTGPTKTNDTVAAPGKNYYYYDEVTDELVKLDVKEGDSLVDLAKIHDGLYSQAASNPVETVIDEGAKPESGYTYYYVDSETGEFVEIEFKENETLEEARARLGIDKLYVKDTRPLSCNDTYATVGSLYYYLNESGEYEKIEIEPGGDLSNYREIHGTIYKQVDYVPEFIITSDVERKSDKTYYYVNENGVYVILPPSETFPLGTVVYERVVAISGDTDGAKVFTGSGACVLPDGTMIGERVSMDSGNYNRCIKTQGLVTATGMLAADLAKLPGINLSVYQIKMGLLIDHEVNGSRLPDDVKAERISTILDKIADED